MQNESCELYTEKLYWWYTVHGLELLSIRGRLTYKSKLLVLVLGGQGERRRMLLENLDSLVKMQNL